MSQAATPTQDPMVAFIPSHKPGYSACSRISCTEIVLTSKSAVVHIDARDIPNDLRQVRRCDVRADGFCVQVLSRPPYTVACEQDATLNSPVDVIAGAHSNASNIRSSGPLA